MRPDEIVSAIVQGDARQLEAIKGIGKKSAERLVLELKDKLSKISLHNNPLGGFAVVQANPHQDAIQALIALGIQKAVAEKAVDKTIKAEEGQLSLETLIKAALKNC
jgi:Holliday junction DNA helicase RuvA